MLSLKFVNNPQKVSLLTTTPTQVIKSEELNYKYKQQLGSKQEGNGVGAKKVIRVNKG